MLQRSFPGLFLMTSVLIFPLLLFSSLQTNAQSSKNNFYLAGHIKGMDGNYIFFSYRGLGNERKWDSIFVKNGAFNFKGTITQPAKSLLTILKSNRTSTIDPNVTLPLFIEPTHMHIILRRNHFREAILVGSKSEDEFMELLNKSKTVSKQLDPLINKRNELDEKFAIENSSGSDSLSGIIQKLSKLNHTIGGLQEKEFRIVKSFLEKYPQSYITAYKIVDDIRHFNLAQLKRYYARMPKELRESEYGQELGIDIYKMSKGSPGSVAADFSAEDLEGNQVRLVDFKDKYVLLDFWASWCKPCRAGNPELKTLYFTYHKLGIEFMGLSNDKDDAQWKAAVALDGIDIWKQVKEDEIGDLYHVQGLPTKILIAPDGIIIGRYSSDDGEPAENLAIKLKKLFLAKAKPKKAT